MATVQFYFNLLNFSVCSELIENDLAKCDPYSITIGDVHLLKNAQLLVVYSSIGQSAKSSWFFFLFYIVIS